MLTYLLIRTKHGKSRIAYDKLLKHKEFIELHELFGRWDIIGLVESKDLTELRLFLQNKIWIIEDLEKAETLIVSGIASSAGAAISSAAAQPVLSGTAPSDEDDDEIDEDGQFLPP